MRLLKVKILLHLYSKLILKFTSLLAHFAQTELYQNNRRNCTLKLDHEKFRKQNLCELAVKWDCFEQATDLLAELQYLNVSTRFL